MTEVFGNFGCIYKSETGVVSREINQATKYAYAKYWQNALTFEMYCKYITSKPNGFLNGMQKLPLKFMVFIIFTNQFCYYFCKNCPDKISSLTSDLKLSSSWYFFLLSFLILIPPTFTNNIMEKENNFCVQGYYIYKRPCRLRLATKING